jgi:hypothetical protein
MYENVKDPNSQDYKFLQELCVPHCTALPTLAKCKLIKVHFIRHQHLAELVEKRGLTNPVPLRVADGLEAIPAGLADLKAGKVSACKLVYRIS